MPASLHGRASESTRGLFQAAARRAAEQLSDRDLLAVESLINQLIADQLISQGDRSLVTVHFGDTKSGEGDEGELREPPTHLRNPTLYTRPTLLDSLTVGSAGLSWSPQLKDSNSASALTRWSVKDLAHWLVAKTKPLIANSRWGCDLLFWDSVRLYDEYRSTIWKDIQPDNIVIYSAAGPGQALGETCRLNRCVLDSEQDSFIELERRIASLYGTVSLHRPLVCLSSPIFSYPPSSETETATPAPQADTGRETRDADQDALERHFEWRMQLLRDSLGTPDVSALLAITPQGVRKRIDRKELLAIKHVGDYRFPRWQFDASTESGTVNGLTRVLKVLVIEPISIAGWLTRQQPALRDRAPIDALKAGDVDLVVAEAQSVGVT